ncbi:MAG: hypothetical protein ICV83_16400, partial [Cytophagales bacterium]|nr:hypothetical protein [Cytophagales bacterium]
MRKLYQMRRVLAPGMWVGLWLALCSGPLAARPAGIGPDPFGTAAPERVPTAEAPAAVGMFNSVAAPTDLTAVAASATGVKLTWNDNATGESGFRIERSLYSLSGFTQVATVGANITTYTNAGLTPNNYYYRVRAFTSSYQTPYTNVAQAVLTTSPVRMTDAVVTTCGATFLDGGLTANYGNNSNRTLVFAPTAPGNKVRVTFTSFSTEAGKDVLYVYDGGSTSAPLLNAYSGNVLPPALTARNAEGKLTFRFVSNASVTAAGWQATVSCVARPVAPSNLTTVVTTNQAKLTWTDNGTNETGFKIERSPYPNREFTQIATVGPNVTTFTNQGLLPNTVYYYRVRSYLDGFNTPYSNTASAVNSPQVILVNKRLSESSVAVAACNAIVLDGGGTGNYQPGGQYVREIVPSTPGTKVRLVIEFADFESGDKVTILDGGKNSGKVIAEFPGEWWLPLEALATNPEGKLTVILSNDSDTQVSSGFQGRVTCTPTSEPPIDLFATVLSSTQVKLGWTDVSATESGFKIYRSEGFNGGDLVQIATV